jgi:hypothetical protein
MQDSAGHFNHPTASTAWLDPSIPARRLLQPLYKQFSPRLKPD